MKVLVYGAGVLGSYLAHVLVRAGNDVTMLARGNRYKELAQNGLVVRHAVQLKTTEDKVNLIQNLKPEDIYDIIFIVMQYTQLQEVLPALAANRSKLFVFVGNNVTPVDMKTAICGSSRDKTVLFGFQETGGRHEDGRIVSIHAGAKMYVGTLKGENFIPQRKLLLRAFRKTKYKLIFRQDMESFLISHVAFIMPIAYACYATNGYLKKADKALLHQIIDAATEGFDVLKANGIPVSPPEDENFVRNKRGRYYCFLWICAKTFIGRLAASDHAMHAITEIAALSDAFDKLKKQVVISTPVWNKLEKYLNGLYNKL